MNLRHVAEAVARAHDLYSVVAKCVSYAVYIGS